MTQKCDKNEEKLPRYLARRNAHYYVRLVAPTAIHHLLSAKDRVFRKSTYTGDVNRAKVIAAQLVAQKRSEWLRLQEAMRPGITAKTLLNTQLIQQIAGARLHAWVATDNRERLGEGGLDDEQLAEIEAFCKYSDGAMRRILAQGRASKEWSDIVEEVLDWCLTLGYDVDEKTDAHFPELVREYAKAERKAQQFIAARNAGEDPDVDAILPKTGARLSELLEKYEAERRGKVAPKTISKSTSVWKRLIDFKGDVFLDEVTSGDIYGFFKDRLDSKNKCWSQDYVEGFASRTLTDMFNLAQSVGYMRGEGPMGRLLKTPELSKEERERRLKPRYPYSDAQINTLLSSLWYDASSPYFKGKMAQDFGARYFGPLIGLLHGVRVTESMQLKVGDVGIVDGVLCLSFKEDPAGDDANGTQKEKLRQVDGADLPRRTVKNESVLRTIPVHPKLIELGFDDFVNERRQLGGSNAPLFPSAVPNPDGKNPKWGRSYEQAFLRFVRDKLEFGNGYGSHSFRHQFEDRIRDCQARGPIWPAGMAELLSGRKMPREGDRDLYRKTGSAQGYGNGYRPSAVLPYLEKMTYADVTFPAQFKIWSAAKS